MCADKSNTTNCFPKWTETDRDRQKRTETDSKGQEETKQTEMDRNINQNKWTETERSLDNPTKTDMKPTETDRVGTGEGGGDGRKPSEN